MQNQLSFTEIAQKSMKLKHKIERLCLLTAVYCCVLTCGSQGRLADNCCYMYYHCVVV